ncbi:hypothetical protein TNCV_3506111 [Trichonephila clavipes]|uniref:Uncharacterized protein n=1 Tax=Trichonephila clavipes TaxID=2585209 RepID=A0A8X6RYY7_TRICX|nr:hypothetical protein TNCV_3506111 [Trichonephila clavipes]
MVLKVNDRRTSCPCHDEFRGPRSDYVRQFVFRVRIGLSSFKNDSADCENLGVTIDEPCAAVIWPNLLLGRKMKEMNKKGM